MREYGTGGRSLSYLTPGPGGLILPMAEVPAWATHAGLTHVSETDKYRAFLYLDSDEAVEEAIRLVSGAGGAIRRDHDFAATDDSRQKWSWMDFRAGRTDRNASGSPSSTPSRRGGP